jgi:hypothetical protein
MSKTETDLNKFKKRRNVITEKTLGLPIVDFLKYCYQNCTPSKYGQIFPKKVVKDSNNKITELSPTLDRGDIHINYKVFLEGKISFMNMNGKYSITNIRGWQKLDYFLLCFVDDNIQPHFYCVPKKTITDNPHITLTPMNNSASRNIHNTYVGMRTSINQDDLNWLFKKNNVLKGTSYKHLLSFIDKTFIQIKSTK